MMGGKALVHSDWHEVMSSGDFSRSQAALHPAASPQVQALTQLRFEVLGGGTACVQTHSAAIWVHIVREGGALDAWHLVLPCGEGRRDRIRAAPQRPPEGGRAVYPGGGWAAVRRVAVG
eukprot:CAMPEP_0173415380 /NCGR_PEP_ID=MMETSP1356-20130122/84829_1 /TAXON_ID=77927 ORGANISM="Hemiselmis virescens, Strain PCC157" /NCGR_SAMPLE_ID=MMETSP1356 /ASSEMBLY_ACC=CAM_ASM_000847 /LENGTH=118 /DNA_ID=CAMNT_0014377623 /DNA_START=839 /DNA_END=1195 /DNA_ORIENTATION=-